MTEDESGITEPSPPSIDDLISSVPGFVAGSETWTSPTDHELADIDRFDDTVVLPPRQTIPSPLPSYAAVEPVEPEPSSDNTLSIGWIAVAEPPTESDVEGETILPASFVDDFDPVIVRRRRSAAKVGAVAAVTALGMAFAIVQLVGGGDDARTVGVDTDSPSTVIDSPTQPTGPESTLSRDGTGTTVKRRGEGGSTKPTSTTDAAPTRVPPTAVARPDNSRAGTGSGGTPNSPAPTEPTTPISRPDPPTTRPATPTTSPPTTPTTPPPPPAPSPPPVNLTGVARDCNATRCAIRATVGAYPPSQGEFQFVLSGTGSGPCQTTCTATCANRQCSVVYPKDVGANICITVKITTVRASDGRRFGSSSASGCA